MSEAAENGSPTTRRFAIVVTAGALLLVAIIFGVMRLLAPVISQIPTTARVPRTAVLPLPKELKGVL
jgi:hypothetical protein